VIERAPVEVGHADIGEDDVIAFRRHPVQSSRPEHTVST
jgi:hypothetical protein